MTESDRNVTIDYELVPTSNSGHVTGHRAMFGLIAMGWALEEAEEV